MTAGEPYVWKLAASPSRHYLVWNLNPADEIAEIHYHLIRERNGFISSSVDYYYPRIQMEWAVDAKERSYGALPYPAEWAEIMEAAQPSNRWNPGNAFTSWLSGGPLPEFRLMWHTYARDGEWTYPGRSAGGATYRHGNLTIDWIIYVNEGELERAARE